VRSAKCQICGGLTGREPGDSSVGVASDDDNDGNAAGPKRSPAKPAERLVGSASEAERSFARLSPAERAVVLSAQLKEKEFEQRIAAEASAWWGCACMGGFACGGVALMFLGSLCTGHIFFGHGAPPIRPGWAIAIGFAATTVGGLAALIFIGPAVIGCVKWIGTILARMRAERRG